MKKSLLASILIIAALGGYLIYTNTKGGPDVPDLPAWEGSADEVSIKRPSDTLTLTRKDGLWRINTEAYPADSKAVQELEKNLREIEIADIVSEKGLFSAYDLTPDKATEVTVRKGGEVLRRITFGKKSTASQHIFVRIGDGKEIYMARGGFDSLLDASVEGLRDKNIVKIPRNGITGLTFTYKGRSIAFVRETAAKGGSKGKNNAKAEGRDGKKAASVQWVYRGVKTVTLNAQRMNSLLSAFDPLRGTGFPGVAKDTLKAPLASAVIKSREKEITVGVYKNGDEYYAVSSESPYVFSINEWTAKKFFIEDIEGFR